MALITRTSKGSPLTHSELDGNIAELDRRTEVSWQSQRGQLSISGIPTPPTMTLYNGIYLPSFDPDNVNEATVTIHVPHDYVAGSDIYVHGHFLTAAATSGTVRWGFTLSWAIPNRGETVTTEQKFTTPYTSYIEHAVTSSDQDVHHIEESTAISIPYLVSESLINMRVFRDASHVNDTYPSSVFLIVVGLTYQSHGFGTVTR